MGDKRAWVCCMWSGALQKVEGVGGRRVGWVEVAKKRGEGEDAWCQDGGQANEGEARGFIVTAFIFLEDENPWGWNIGTWLLVLETLVRSPGVAPGEHRYIGTHFLRS